VLPNFSAFQALGAAASAQPTTTQQIYNVMAVASQDLPVLTMNPSRKLILQIIANLRSTINTNRIEEIVPFHLRSYVKIQFASLFNHSEKDREACAHFLSWSKEDFCTAFDAAFPEVGHYSQGAQTFIEKITQLNLAFDLAKPKIELTTDDSLDKICEEDRDRTRSDELKLSSLGDQLFLQCLKQRVLSFDKQNPSGLSAHLLRIRLSEPRLLLNPLRISFLSATSGNAMSLLVTHLGVQAVAVLSTKLRTVNLTNQSSSTSLQLLVRVLKHTLSSSLNSRR
jgi:hypothetical protein